MSKSKCFLPQQKAYYQGGRNYLRCTIHLQIISYHYIYIIGECRSRSWHLLPSTSPSSRDQDTDTTGFWLPWMPVESLHMTLTRKAAVWGRGVSFAGGCAQCVPRAASSSLRQWGCIGFPPTLIKTILLQLCFHSKCSFFKAFVPKSLLAHLNTTIHLFKRL